ncbi:MAG: hypothetical protein CMJ78_11905 [Planctomycetaceae bacterium]|nr:hypothetical protein [Planctomycetaceae bacterium]
METQTFACCVFLFASIAAESERVPATPGTTVTIDRPKTERGSVTVRVPSDYSPRQKYPVIFWYGANGGPVTQIDGGKGWIVVGMSFAKLERIARIRDYADRNWQLCRDVRRHLAKTLSLNKHSYIGGFSKGGNTAYMIAHVAPKDLSGAIIVGGGKFPAFAVATVTYRKPAAILIGIGNLDINYPLARNAADQLTRSRALVTFVEWPNTGHSTVINEAFKQWFNVQRHREDEEFKEQARSEITMTLAEDSKPSFEQYERLAELLKSPEMIFATTTERKKLERQLTALRSKADVKKAIAAQTAFNDLLAQEAKLTGQLKPNAKALEKLSERFSDFANEHSESKWKELAAAAVKRIRKRIGFKDR